MGAARPAGSARGGRADKQGDAESAPAGFELRPSA